MLLSSQASYAAFLLLCDAATFGGKLLASAKTAFRIHINLTWDTLQFFLRNTGRWSALRFVGTDAPLWWTVVAQSCRTCALIGCPQPDGYNRSGDAAVESRFVAWLSRPCSR
jgi:hypothetical protein